MRLGFAVGALAAVVSIACALPVHAQTASASGRDTTWGTTAHKKGFKRPNAGRSAEAASIQPSLIYVNASVGTGGVGLRNRGAGAIDVSGVTGPVQAAYLYWAVITQGTPTQADRSVKITRLSPTAPGGIKPAAAPRIVGPKAIPGGVVGQGPSPCWPGNQITVFRGKVPAALAVGNGLYLVTLNAGASGATGGEDPWSVTTLPLMEGASLVIIGSGNQTAAIFDKNLAGSTFYSYPGLSYGLALPADPVAANQVIFREIGADGQVGFDLSAVLATSEEDTYVNGIAVAGPGAPTSDSDWNGSVAGPVAQLWDDEAHDVTFAFHAQSTAAPHARPAQAGNAMSVSVFSANAGDCLTPVANIVALSP